MRFALLGSCERCPACSIMGTPMGISGPIWFKCLYNFFHLSEMDSNMTYSGDQLCGLYMNATYRPTTFLEKSQASTFQPRAFSNTYKLVSSSISSSFMVEGYNHYSRIQNCTDSSHHKSRKEGNNHNSFKVKSGDPKKYNTIDR